MSQKLIGVLIAGVMLCYPLAVYWGLQVLKPWHIALLLGLLLMLRLSLFSSRQQLDKRLLGLGILYFAFAIWDNSVLSLRLYPVWINFCLWLVFSLSLLHPPTVIECIARLQTPDLPPSGVRYTRSVTQVWCGFFVLNGLVAFVTAYWASFFWWSLYNGCIAYVLMGLIMGIEYLIRCRMQRHASES